MHEIQYWLTAYETRNERFAPVCVAEHDRYGKGSVLVWAGISMQVKTDLHIIENGTLTAVRYVNVMSYRMQVP